MDEKEGSPSFKVVDKRAAFGGESDQEKSSPKRAEPEKTKETPAPISFSLFIQSMAHQAMMGLGFATWPDSGLVRVELNLAREMIDILLVLQKKTANNLDKEEQALLDTIVYQLQVAFLETAKKPAGDSVLIK